MAIREWADINRMMDSEGMVDQVMVAATTKAEATIAEAVENQGWPARVNTENTERRSTKTRFIKLKMAAAIDQHSKLNKGNQRIHLLNQRAGFRPRVQ